MFLQFQGRVGTGQQILDGDLRDLQIVTLDTGIYLYATTGAGGGLTGYGLDEGALADWQDSLYYGAIAPDLISGSLAFLGSGPEDLLVFGGAGTLQAVRLGADGQIETRVQTGTMTGGTEAICAVAAVTLETGMAVYVADDGTGALTTYAADGNDLVQQAGGAVPGLQGTVAMTTVTVSGNTFLLAADQGVQGVSSFRINPQTGALTSADTMGANNGLGISVPTAMEVVQVHGATWVILAGAESSSLSVMRVTGTGELIATDHVIDTLHTRFGGVQSLAVVETEGQVFIVAGGADDGLSLFTLLPDGRLAHVQTIAHWGANQLMDVSEIAAQRVGDEIQIFVASEEAAGLSQFTISLDNLGVTRTDGSSGGAGNDLLVSTGDDTILGRAGDDILVAGWGDTVMTGGSGADLFVLASGGHHATITDFDPNNDRLDLSAWPMLRDPGQLTITPTRWGAVITYHDNSLTIYTASGQPLANIGSYFSSPDRVLILGTPGGQTLTGSRENDLLTGDDGNDTIDAGGGHDQIDARAGDDSIQAGWGHDHVSAGDGHDTVDAAGGDDTLLGGAGNDSLWGGENNDEIWGGDGNDTISGGEDADLLGGGAGNDIILGGAGSDTIYASSGDDSLEGNGGQDTIWGGRGNDLIRAGAQDDEIGGGAGNGRDSLWGGDGNDTIWGGAGHDLAYGETGADLIGGGSGMDTIWGGDGWDTLYGGYGDDSLMGEGGADEVWGGNGNDSLSGDLGDDSLSGGAGADTLSGGAGDDLLTGGSNPDVFLFETDHGTDRITDFTPGTDRLRLLGTAGDFDDLTLSATTGGVLIDTGDGTIVLEGLSLSDLGAADFVFI
ncbi:calcium-binding protein [Thalassobius sp. S69A]|uniref:calcium-binding protein n=1 Tax=unclassified Thalassovita TaxID=2619711 RepID=UPI000C11AB9A|nr:hypothetical protein [Paracoccaceae bacterium]MBT26897.1 hypothetical protein [Paracoccaceae bacterium]